MVMYVVCMFGSGGIGDNDRGKGCSGFMGDKGSVKSGCVGSLLIMWVVVLRVRVRVRVSWVWVVCRLVGVSGLWFMGDRVSEKLGSIGSCVWLCVVWLRVRVSVDVCMLEGVSMSEGMWADTAQTDVTGHCLRGVASIVVIVVLMDGMVIMSEAEGVMGLSVVMLGFEG